MPDRPTLTETVALLEATLEATRDGILVVDLNRRVPLLWNRTYLRMFGISEDVLRARGIDGIIDTLRPQLENGDQVAETSRRLWTNPDRAIVDTLRFKDGRVFERYVAPHRIGGDVVWLIASIHDVTRTATIQQALEQHRAFLEKAQEVAHIGSWIAELDGSGRVGWSRETSRLFGIDPGRFDGTAATFFDLVHAEDRGGVRALFDAAAAHDHFQIDHRIVRGDRAVRWVHEEADVVRDEAGRPRRLIGTVQDITERRQLEDQLRQAQKMEAIGRLAGGIAHDINNALTAIAGYAELALAELAADHASRPDVEEIRRAAERAGSVTRQLLAFSRKQLIEPRLFNVNDTVESIARLLSRVVGPDIRVRTALSGELRPILGDPGQVEQAIVNLAVNARDAMPDGGEVVLTTTYQIVDEAVARLHVPMPPGEYVVLSVRDTGHGMTPETCARIFEPFFTTKPAGKGTGLGLSMVYGTVKQIGGFVFVESEVGRGTTFSLYFPPAPHTDVERRHEPVHEAAEGARATILIAEDEDAVRHLVASALRTEPYRLLLAASAEDALRIADSHDGAIDLLLTDAIMPGRSGVELATILTGRWPGLRVVFMSGYTEEDLNVATTRPVAVLQKPFTPRDLRQRIRSALISST